MSDSVEMVIKHTVVCVDGIYEIFKKGDAEQKMDDERICKNGETNAEFQRRKF